MPKMQKQERNSELVRNMSADFVTNKVFYLDPARLWAAVRCACPVGNAGEVASLMYGWMADAWHVEALIGQQLLTGVNIGWTDHGVTQYGGPYFDLDGTEAFYDADNAYQEAVANEFFVWHWCRPSTVAGQGVVASKYDSNLNNISWALYRSTNTFRFVCDALGTGAGAVSVTSSYTVSADEWYFVAGHFVPSTLMRIFVGGPGDNALTYDDLAVGVPASLFDGTAPLGIGTAFNNAPTLLIPWQGYIGIGGARVGMSSTVVNAYAHKLFGLTREFYQ